MHTSYIVERYNFLMCDNRYSLTVRSLLVIVILQNRVKFSFSIYSFSKALFRRHILDKFTSTWRKGCIRLCKKNICFSLTQHFFTLRSFFLLITKLTMTSALWYSNLDDSEYWFVVLKKFSLLANVGTFLSIFYLVRWSDVENEATSENFTAVQIQHCWIFLFFQWCITL